MVLFRRAEMIRACPTSRHVFRITLRRWAVRPRGFFYARMPARLAFGVAPCCGDFFPRSAQINSLFGASGIQALYSGKGYRNSDGGSAKNQPFPVNTLISRELSLQRRVRSRFAPAPSFGSRFYQISRLLRRCRKRGLFRAFFGRGGIDTGHRDTRSAVTRAQEAPISLSAFAAVPLAVAPAEAEEPTAGAQENTLAGIEP